MIKYLKSFFIHEVLSIHVFKTFKRFCCQQGNTTVAVIPDVMAINVMRRNHDAM